MSSQKTDVWHNFMSAPFHKARANQPDIIQGFTRPNSFLLAYSRIDVHATTYRLTLKVYSIYRVDTVKGCVDKMNVSPKKQYKVDIVKGLRQAPTGLHPRNYIYAKTSQLQHHLPNVWLPIHTDNYCGWKLGHSKYWCNTAVINHSWKCCQIYPFHQLETPYSSPSSLMTRSQCKKTLKYTRIGQLFVQFCPELPHAWNLERL